MRSKEEKEAIKSLENFVNQKYYNGVTADEMKTVLNYIEKLEKQDEKDFTSIYIYAIEDFKKKIRDKIKEIKDYIEEFKPQGYIEDELNAKISVLKELLGE